MPTGTSTGVFIGTATGLIAVFIGLLAAVVGFRRNIKADIQSSESLTYFPSSEDPWNRGDWLRNVGFFGSYLAMFFSIVYIEFSSIAFPAKLIWTVLSILALIAMGFTSQSIIYGVIEKPIEESEETKQTSSLLDKFKLPLKGHLVFF